MSVDPSLFRQAMSRFASGVTVVTTSVGEALSGITVSSFASLSLDPTLVLICIDRGAASHDAIAEAGQFAVNILAEGQADVSQRFASRDGERFLPGTFTRSPRGLPLLAGALAHVECRLAASLPGGDHTIFVGEVVAAEVTDGSPLLYFRSAYQRMA